MSADLELKKVEDVLLQLQEDPNNYQISLSNWSVNLVKLLVSLKTNEFEIQRLKEEFKGCSSNEEKIKYLYTNQQLKEKLMELMDDMMDAREASNKDWDKAKKFRLDGRKKMETKDYEEALWYQSRAILSAHFPGTKRNETQENKLELANAFYERAEVLFRMKRYKDCLKDVEYANKFGLEFTTNARLLLLKIRCSKFLGEMQTMAPEALQGLIEALEELEADTKDPKLTEEIVELIEDIKNPYGTRPEAVIAKKATITGALYADSNKSIPAVSKLLKLCLTAKQGRHLVTTGDIPGNSNVVIETPYVAVLTLPAFKSYCNYCFKNLEGRTYPCRSCDKVIYCEEECEQKAYEEYHKLECQYVAVITDAEIFRLSLRTILKTGVDKALSTYRNAGNSKEVHTNNYASLLTLVEHSENLPLINSLSYAIVATFFAILIRDKMKLIPMKDENTLFILGGLLLKHIKQAVFNGIGIMVNEETDHGLSIDGTKIGLGFYPSAALLNHSCNSNVTPMFEGTKLYMVTKRNLKNSEEVTYSYGPQVYHESRRMRQKELQNFLFKCECVSCTDPIEDYRDAVICPKCEGPVVYDERNLSSKCLECKDDNTGIDVSKIVSDLRSLQLKMQYIIAYFQSGRVKNPAESFENVLVELQKFCYYKNQQLLNVKDILIGFYLKSQNYEKAIQLCQEILAVEKELFGESSMYYIYRLVKVTVWRWIVASKSGNTSAIEELRTETATVIKLAEETFMKRQEEGAVYISSNYVSCQRELKHLKERLV